MSAPTGTASLVEASRAALLAFGSSDPRLFFVDAESPGGPEFSTRFPERYRAIPPSDPALLPTAVQRAAEGRTVFLSAEASAVVGPAYSLLRSGIAGPRADVKILASHPDPSIPATADRPMVEDIGLMRGLPGMTVVVPADGPSAGSAVVAVAERPGPAYLRLSRRPLPPVTDGKFRLAHAPVLRDGSDLAFVALGAMVAPALSVAAELGNVGVSVRVLDLASVKPFDEPALLRAARDTGAVLVAEEHSVTTGAGALVASVTAENYPVPVRRIGYPDLFPTGERPGDRPGAPVLSEERLTEEAWELLRVRGKVE